MGFAAAKVEESVKTKAIAKKQVAVFFIIISCIYRFCWIELITTWGGAMTSRLLTPK